LPSENEERRFFFLDSQTKNPMTRAFRAIRIKGFIALVYLTQLGIIIQALKAKKQKKTCPLYTTLIARFLTI
jgi:hypothetical protein